MSTETAEQNAATVQEIKSACPGCSNDFVVSSMEQGRSVEQCKDAWMQEMATDLATSSEQIETLTKERDDARAELATAKSGSTQTKPTAFEGVDEVTAEGDLTSGSGSALQAWNDAINKEMSDRSISRSQAIANVARREPSLRESMLEEQQAEYRSRGRRAS